MTLILVLGPINASSRLRMNQEPEGDSIPFSIPKVQLNLEIGKLFIGISKMQYRNIIALADNLSRMSKGVPYRKYRPLLNQYRGHYKEWWLFAYESVLEEFVRRRRRNWNWEHILEYRNRCREYGALYKQNAVKEVIRTTSSVYWRRGFHYFFYFQIKGPVKEQMEECMRQLDVTSIVIIRQQIEIELQRMSTTDDKAQKGWFSWMWQGFSGQKEEGISGAAICKSFFFLYFRL